MLFAQSAQFGQIPEFISHPVKKVSPWRVIEIETARAKMQIVLKTI